MGRIESNSDGLRRVIDEKVRAGLEFVAIRAHEIAEDELSDQFPPASVPGEYPARRTGQLVDSLRSGFDVSGWRSFFGIHGSEPQYEPNRHPGGIHSPCNQ